MFNIFPTIFEVLLVSGILVSLYNCISLCHYSCYVCVLLTLYNIRDLNIQHRQRERQKTRRRCLSFLTGTLRSNDADGDERVKKTIGFILRKTTTLHVHHAFLYISLPVFARPRREKCLISRFMEYVDKQQRNFTSLSELGYGPSEFNSRRVRLHFT